MKEQIRKFIQEVIEKLYPELKEIEFSVDYAPANIEADFASNAALVLGKRLGLKPLELAILLQEKLNQAETNFEAHVAEPGFLNFKLSQKTWQEALEKILKQGQKYGASQTNKGKKARVEYVSANPTGPIHIGNARGGPYGEVICNVLESTGYKVLREYYHNDIGGQVEKLGQTVWYWFQMEQGKKVDFPVGGYQGEYLKEVAEEAVKKLGHKLAVGDLGKLIHFALEYIYKENFKLLKDLGIEFDLIMKESKLRSSGKTKQSVEEMKKKALAKEKEGALWFAPNDEYLADREAVIVKSDGKPTYFASDIAYHKEKFTSGYDLVIDILGSNHHGHVPKLRALTKIFDFPPEKFVVLLYQYVRVKRGNDVVRMSKRAGTYVTGREVFDEVGKDSMIFTLLMTAINTHVDFDLELAKDTSEKNPVYKVQYAHARCCSIERKAKSAKSKIPMQELKLLQDPEEIRLIRELARFPEVIEDISQNNTAHHLPHYLLGLSENFHKFYEKVRVISDDEKLTLARLALVSAAKTVLANGLQLMGIKPREKM